MHGRTTISSPWQPILLSVLADWHGDSDAERHHREAPADRRARAFVEKAAELETDQRPEFLAALRHRLEAASLDRVHPTWIAAALPAEPLLRLWVLDGLPRPVRRRVLAELDAEPVERRALPATAPPWFQRWWRREMRAVIDVPVPVPGAVDKNEVLEYLDLFEPGQIETALEAWGLRPLAAALQGVEESEVVALVLALPAHQRQRLIELSRQGDVPESDPWHRRFVELTAERDDRPVSRLALLLGLEDVAAQAEAVASVGGAARIAYRLPRSIGRRALERLAAGPGDLAVADPDAWRRRFAAHLDELIRVGRVPALDPGEEIWR